MSCFLFLLPFWYGLFYEYTAFITGIILTVILYIMIRQNKKLIITKSKNFYLYLALVTSYLIVSIWAVDKELAIEGFLKFLPGIVYFVICMQLEREKSKELINIVPACAATMCIVAYILQFIPMLQSSFFSENGRLVRIFSIFKYICAISLNRHCDYCKQEGN